MNRHLAAWALVALLGAPIVAGEKADKGPAAEFYPTAEGTRWVMRWTFTDGSDPEEDVIEVLEEQIVNGYRKWRVRVTTPATGEDAREGDTESYEAWEFYDVDREAYVSRGIDEEGETPYTLLYYPAPAGATFTDDVDAVTTRVVATNRKVRVPAGTFECLVFEVDYTNGALDTVSLTGDDETADGQPLGDEDDERGEDEAFDDTIAVEYWAKGVGLVKSEEYDVSDGGRRLTARQELKSITHPK